MRREAARVRWNGLVGYLTNQAIKNPQSFLPLLGKIVPKEIGADVTVTHTLEDYVLAIAAESRQKSLTIAHEPLKDAVQ
jgi:hypothetical protein